MQINKHSVLNRRDALILKDTVESFIELFQPVSSALLKKKFKYQFSPATIRAILSKLEKLGYLMHPFTSSGRIPTDQGYRYYVDNMDALDFYEVISPQDLKLDLMNISTNVEDLMEATAAMLSRLSHLFGIVIISKFEHSILTEIELVNLQHNRVMLVLTMESGFVRSIILNLDIEIKPEYLDLISSILKDRLVGLSLDEIHLTINERLNDTEIYAHEIVQVLVKYPSEHFVIDSNKVIYTSSPYALLQQPDFHDLDIVRKLLPALEKSHLTKLFQQKFLGKPARTLIGDETEDELLHECAIITASFENAQLRGRLGIMGPRRMQYKSIQTLLNNFAEILPSVI